MSEELNPTSTSEAEESNEVATAEVAAPVVEQEASPAAAPTPVAAPAPAPSAPAAAASLPTVVSGPQEFSGEYQGGRSRRIGNDVRFDEISYKNTSLLVRFMDQRGRILSRRKTRVSAKVQRHIVKSIKIARHLALLPFTADQTRIVRKRR